MYKSPTVKAGLFLVRTPGSCSGSKTDAVNGLRFPFRKKMMWKFTPGAIVVKIFNIVNTPDVGV